MVALIYQWNLSSVLIGVECLFQIPETPAKTSRTIFNNSGMRVGTFASPLILEEMVSGFL